MPAPPPALTLPPLPPGGAFGGLPGGMLPAFSIGAPGGMVGPPGGMPPPLLQPLPPPPPLLTPPLPLLTPAASLSPRVAEPKLEVAAPPAPAGALVPPPPPPPRALVPPPPPPRPRPWLPGPVVPTERDAAQRIGDRFYPLVERIRESKVGWFGVAALFGLTLPIILLRQSFDVRLRLAFAALAFLSWIALIQDLG